MKQMQGIGQLLWKLREKEGIRQKQLYMGISSLSKYARIEADQQEIDFFLIDRIMGRLGKSVERLTYILPMDVYKIYELRQEVQQKICQRKWEEAEQYLDEYEKNKRAKEPLHRQFIEQERAQIAWLRGESVELVCEHLETAILQTMPEAENQRKTGVLSAEEYKLLLFRWEVCQETEQKRAKDEIKALALVMTSVFATTVKAETNAELKNRVYEEVLNNHITNESDVIKVAIEQYQEKQMKTRAIDAKPDDYLSITQVVDENGSEQDIISTGLLIVDEHQQRVAITDIVSNTGQLSQYSIYATMKVSVTNDRQALKVRINWFETTLNYGTSMKASSLMQTSKYSPEVGFQYDDITKTISNPAGGTPYHYTPNNTQMITYSTLECGRSCRSYIKAGTSSLNIAYCVISSAPGGRWERA